MQIAVFGGSFDPPHIGHETIVKKILQELDIDKLFIIPTFLNPFKKTFFLEPHKRLELLQELFKDDKKIEILDYEIKQNKAVPTIQTINHIEKNYKDITKIYLIIGADNLKTLHLWNNFDILNSKVEFIVITRDKYEAKNGIIQFKTINLNIDISSTTLRNNLNLTYIPNKIKQKVIKYYERKNK